MAEKIFFENGENEDGMKRIYLDLEPFEVLYGMIGSTADQNRKALHREAEDAIREEKKVAAKREEAMRKRCEALAEQFARKNADYGGAFFSTFAHYGMMSALIRLSDKLERLKNIYIANGGTAYVKSESVEDTLMDLASYALMTILAMQEEQEEG